jgi:hypothetical protein
MLFGFVTLFFATDSFSDSPAHFQFDRYNYRYSLSFFIGIYLVWHIFYGTEEYLVD